MENRFPLGITGYYIELKLDEGEVWFGEMECPEYASVTNTFSETSFFTDSFMLIFYRFLQISTVEIKKNDVISL